MEQQQPTDPQEEMVSDAELDQEYGGYPEMGISAQSAVCTR